MDKNAIKKYAVWARNELIARVSQKAQQYGITEEGYGDKNADSVNGVLLSATEKKQRQALIAKIDAEGFEQVMEEVAYTWFNRFTALRFMEVNNYLPSHTRIFTNESNEFKPQILTDAISLELEGLDMEKVYELKDANKDEELYKYLLIVQCNALSSILPGMFQKIADYTELLLPDYLLREGSVLDQLIEMIPEDNFNMTDENGQVEIIGWLYQYYNDEKKNEVINIYKGTVKKEDVPAATQLFTTDWVVRYIIDNSLGRYWIERNPNSKLKEKLEYFVESKQGDINVVNESIVPQKLTIFDPCMGSGHFLVYAFDVLLQIYLEYGYSEREAVSEIIENNIYGLDIDSRASQLAYFAVMMKARQYDRRFFSRMLQPKVFAFSESNNIDANMIDHFCGESTNIRSELNKLLSTFKDAKEYGSIIQVGNIDFSLLKSRIEAVKEEISFFVYDDQNDLVKLINIAEIMAKKYAIVATNPPYLNKMNPKLKKFVEANYRDYWNDLFSVFMYRNFGFCEPGGYSGFMTPFVWMFIKVYEKTRNFILSSKEITTLVQMEYSAFEEATVPICSFVLRNAKTERNGLYIKLSDFRGGMDVQRDKVLEALHKEQCDYFFETHEDNFFRIPGNPIAYWVSENLIKTFEVGTPLGEISKPRQGMATTDNNRFLRMWYEVALKNIGFGLEDIEDTICDCKWFPYNKGGDYRKWYGNNDYVVNFKNKGKEVCDYIDATSKVNSKGRVINREHYFKECISWSLISSSNIAFRHKKGFIFDVAGMSCFAPHDKLMYLLGLSNTKVVNVIMKTLAPTINYQVGDIANIPVIFSQEDEAEIKMLVERNIELEKEDWDSSELSWDFTSQYLVGSYSLIEDAFQAWEKTCQDRRMELKKNEERLNEIFIKIYGLEGEITPEVDDYYITSRESDKSTDIRNFISYAVGCMFGRYSLETPGVVYAGGEWSEANGIFACDHDNIIPICDDEYFEDDIVGRFIEFVKVAYGAENIEENLKYIARALGSKLSPRDAIRDYFMNGFYVDHIKLYQKRPIYWLFDSGKKNGFKCLIYMHRYQPDTIARIRTDYVHEQQSRYRTALADLEQRINGVSTSERVKLNKQFKTIQDQAEELRKYEEKIHHLADQMISIDLDDGVKENYAKFQDVLAKIK